MIDDKKKIRVLIVDDSLFMRKLLRVKLEKAGVIVVDEAVDGYDAIEKYKRSLPDLVLMDIVMPRMNGIESLKHIKRYHPNAKVIMLTAMGQEKLKEEAKRLGVMYFITKPFKDEELIRAISKVFEANLR